MLAIVVPYATFDTEVGFLIIKQNYIQNKVWLAAFYVHVFSSILVLLAGFTQFSKNIRSKYKSIHQWAGRVYVANILLVTGPAGFILAIYANGGVTSKIAFMTLTILWWYFTYQALRFAINKDFDKHRAYMIRSFALTMSAITLRFWKMMIAHYFGLPPMDIYRIVAWLGFIPNLLFAEYYIFSLRNLLKKNTLALSH